jgi:hypothetical protein
MSCSCKGGFLSSSSSSSSHQAIASREAFYVAQTLYMAVASVDVGDDDDGVVVQQAHMQHWV